MPIPSKNLVSTYSVGYACSSLGASDQPSASDSIPDEQEPYAWYDIDFTVDDLNVFNDINDEGHASALDSWFNDWRNS